MELDKNQKYALVDAVKLIKSNAKAKFDESVEVHFNLGINVKKSEQNVKGTVVLPHGTGKTKRVVAFVSEGKEKEAKDAGADIVGGVELIAEIKKTGKCDFELAIAEPMMMKELAQIARVLGPRGLMPSPKNETVTENIGQTVKDLKGGKVAFRNDDSGNVHQIVGKVSWDETKLKENIDAFLAELKKLRPGGVKGSYIKSASVSSTMGQGVKFSI
ncbi:MAG: 50S ribosomal protein L1 [Patescibacteria group bacterium]